MKLCLAVDQRWLNALALALLACGEPAQSPANESAGACSPEADGGAPTTPDRCAQLAAACTKVSGQPPAISELKQLVPGDALPPEITTQTSHANLDAVWHAGRLYFAFRAAANHFAGPGAVLYVMSSDDHEHWRFETKVALGRDVREPRFLSLNGKLHLYFAVLGKNPLAFEPQGTRVTTLADDCSWSEPEAVLEPGFILWRARALPGANTAYVSGYVGGGSLYSGGDAGLQVSWLRTEDGRSFEPAAGGNGVVLHGGTSEMDFALLDDGGVVALARNEGGDELGFGSRICRASAKSLGDWSCQQDAKKYDSPLLFKHGQQIYLLARRNLTDTGAYDLEQRDLSLSEQDQLYELDYWGKPKRCALWQVDADTLSVSHLLDLPSAGDTCYPALVELDEARVLVYNYTSPIDQPDLSWSEGQQGPTSIYSLVLALPKP